MDGGVPPPFTGHLSEEPPDENHLSSDDSHDEDHSHLRLPSEICDDIPVYATPSNVMVPPILDRSRPEEENPSPQDICSHRELSREDDGMETTVITRNSSLSPDSGIHNQHTVPSQNVSPGEQSLEEAYEDVVEETTSSNCGSVAEETKSIESGIPCNEESRSTSMEPTDSQEPSTSREADTEQLQTNDEDDDEFGDFTDFAVPPPAAESTVGDPQQDKIDDDDWDEFDVAPRVSRLPSLAENQPGEEIVSHIDKGAMESAVPTKDDGWAADFDAFESAAVVPQTVTETDKNVPIIDDINVDDLWDIEEDFEECENKPLNLLDVLRSQTLTEDVQNFDDFFQLSAETWLALRVVEETRALKFEWDTSRYRTHLLSKMNIDPNVAGRNISSLDTDSVLKPVQVSRIANGGASTKRTVVLSSHDGSGAFMAPKETGREKSAPVQNGVVESKQQTAPPSDSVPPADFDWDTSGLVNPLNGAARSSVLMDMDFLSANSGGLTTTVSTLQKELAELGLESGEMNAVNKQMKSNSVFDSILSQKKKSEWKGVAELSLDARALHDQLPDIEYLQATMIMFPFGGKDQPS